MEVLSEGTKKTTKDMRLKDGTVFPAGSVVDDVKFEKQSQDEGAYDTLAVVKIQGRTIKVSPGNLHKYISGFSKPPSMNALEKMSSNGIATTVTGQRTEPDGYGQDGSPSWLLVLGLI